MSGPRRARSFIASTVMAIIVGATPMWNALAQSAADRDPRNWPTLTRFVNDRHEYSGQVVTLRVFAKRSEYFNCAYRGAQSTRMGFTLLGGPLETITGYMARDLGRLLDGVLAKDPWTPITVQVRYDPQKLSDLCPAQVDIVKWSLGWQYPEGSVTPGRPDPTTQPKADEIAYLHKQSPGQGPLWDQLIGKKPRHVVGQEPPAALVAGQQIQVVAGTRLSGAFHCSFKGRARTHWGLRLHDGKGQFVHAYVPKGPESEKLVDYIGLQRNVLLTVQGRLAKTPMSHYCPFQIEVTGWRLTPKPKLERAD